MTFCATREGGHRGITGLAASTAPVTDPAEHSPAPRLADASSVLTTLRSRSWPATATTRPAGAARGSRCCASPAADDALAASMRGRETQRRRRPLRRSRWRWQAGFQRAEHGEELLPARRRVTRGVLLQAVQAQHPHRKAEQRHLQRVVVDRLLRGRRQEGTIACESGELTLEPADLSKATSSTWSSSRRVRACTERSNLPG